MKGQYSVTFFLEGSRKKDSVCVCEGGGGGHIAPTCTFHIIKKHSLPANQLVNHVRGSRGYVYAKGENNKQCLLHIMFVIGLHRNPSLSAKYDGCIIESSMNQLYTPKHMGAWWVLCCDYAHHAESEIGSKKQSNLRHNKQTQHAQLQPGGLWVTS